MSHSKAEEEIEDIDILKFHIQKCQLEVSILIDELNRAVVSKSVLKKHLRKLRAIPEYILEEML